MSIISLSKAEVPLNFIAGIFGSAFIAATVAELFERGGRKLSGDGGV